MGGTVMTGNGITLFRLMALRSAILLEGKGLKFSRGSRLAQAKRELGMKGSRQKIVDALTIKIEEVGMNLKPGEVRSC